MVDWMARTLELPKKFLSEGEGGGVIQVRGRRRAPVSDPTAAHAHTSLAVRVASGHRERGRDCLHAGRADARREHPRQGRPSDRDQAGGLLVIAGAGVAKDGRAPGCRVGGGTRCAHCACVHCTSCGVPCRATRAFKRRRWSQTCSSASCRSRPTTASTLPSWLSRSRCGAHPCAPHTLACPDLVPPRERCLGGQGGRPVAVLCGCHRRHDKLRRRGRPGRRRPNRYGVIQTNTTNTVPLVTHCWGGTCRTSQRPRSVVPCGRRVGWERVHLPGVPPASQGRRARNVLQLQHAQVAPDEL